MTELDVQSELRRALVDRELVLAYQPVVNLHDATIGGVEALLRWRQVDGMRTAGEFLPEVRDPDLIEALAQFVFEEAAEQAATWRRRFESWWFPVSVNVAAPDFTDALVARVAEVRARHGLSIGAIAVEISEPVLLEDPDASRRRVDELKAVGAQVVVDDFGVTHAAAMVADARGVADAGVTRSIDDLTVSLVALEGFAIDVVKVDRTLLERCFTNARDTAVIEAIVKLTHLLGFRVLAEGVESGDEAERLRQAGFDLGQGYYFQRPHGPGHIDRLLIDLADARVAFTAGPRVTGTRTTGPR